MNYEEFKKVLLEELQKIYQGIADVTICEVIKNNGTGYDGLHVIFKDAPHQTNPIIEVKGYYEDYCGEKKNIQECVSEILNTIKQCPLPEQMEYFVSKIIDWEFAKQRVYPILLLTEKNQTLLETLVSTPYMDMSIAYILRDDTVEQWKSCVKINKHMLEEYGISREQLHQQAMDNMNKDGYQFLDMKTMITNLFGEMGKEIELDNRIEMVVLTNKTQFYGAAGLLNEQLLKEFAGDRDYFILPSSLHECIFVPVVNKSDKEQFDEMVKSVNQENVSKEEWLSQHCYFYDAKENKIKMDV